MLVALHILMLAANVPEAIVCPDGIAMSEVRTDYLTEWCIDAEGRKHGPERQWFSFPSANSLGRNGIQAERSYFHGARTGCWQSFFPNGHLEQIDCFEDDRPHGQLRRFFDDGSIQLDANFVRGGIDGTQTLNYRSGKPYRLAKFSNGVPSGEWKWFHRNGQRYRELSFSAGLREGALLEWHETGALLQSGQFTRGIRTGEWIERGSDGHVVSMLPYENGCPRGSLRQDLREGNSIEVSCVVGSTKLGAFEVFSTGGGLPFESATYIGGKKHGVARTWDDLGYESGRATYEDGLRAGAYYEWFPDDFPGIVGSYKKGKRAGRWRGFNWDGSPMFEGSYTETGLKTGTWKGWYMHGPTVEGRFEAGRLVSGKDVLKTMGIPEEESWQGP